MLVLPARLGEFRRERILLLAYLVAFERKCGDLTVPGFFNVGQQDGDTLHLRLRLVPLAGDVLQLRPQLVQFRVGVGDLPVEPLERRAFIGKCADRTALLAGEFREFRLAPLLRFRGGFRRDVRFLVSMARFRELGTELFEFRVQHRVAQHSLAALDEARVLLLQILQRAIGFREPLRNLLPRLNRSGVLRLQFGKQLFPIPDVRLETDVDGVALDLELIALDDQRGQLLFERTALLAKRARDLLAILQDRIALAVEIRRGFRVLALECGELVAKGSQLLARDAARIKCGLQFGDLILLRLHQLFERSDPRLGFDQPRLALRAVFLRLLLEADLLVLQALDRRGLVALELAHFADLRLRLRLDFARRLFRLRPRIVAFEHEDLQPIPIVFDFFFEPIDRPRVQRRHFIGGRAGFREAIFERGDALAGVFEFGGDDAVLVPHRSRLVLQILERLADFGLLHLCLRLDLLAHLALRRLHVQRGVLLPLVGIREEFLRLGTQILLAGEFQRRLALRGFQRLDAPLQFLHRAIVFAFRADTSRRHIGLHGLAGFVRQVRGTPVRDLGDLRGKEFLLLDERIAFGFEFRDFAVVAKLRDLAFQPFDLVVPLLQFRLHPLTILHRLFGDVLAESVGCRSIRGAVHRVVQILAEIFRLGGGVVARLGEGFALARQVRELPFVIPPDDRHASLDLRRKIADLMSLLDRRIGLRRGSADRVRSSGLGRLCRCRIARGNLPEEHRGPRHRTVRRPLRRSPRKPRCLLHSPASRKDRTRWSGRCLGLRAARLRRLLDPQSFGERLVPTLGGSTVAGGFRFSDQFRQLLPGEPDFDIVRLQHLGAENMGHSAVDFRQRDAGIPARNPLRKIVDVEPQLGLQIVRPRQEHLRRDAVQEVAQFQAQFVRGRRALWSIGRAGRKFVRSRRLVLLVDVCVRGGGPAFRGGGRFIGLRFSPETIEKAHAMGWAISIWAGAGVTSGFQARCPEKRSAFVYPSRDSSSFRMNGAHSAANRGGKVTVTIASAPSY